jgi:hypothetical protein
MVPDPRSPVRGLLRVLRASRVLALALAVATGVGAVVAATRYAHVSLYEYILLPLGVGGCTYYFTHYDLSEWIQNAMLRGFLRNFAMASLPVIVLAADPADPSLAGFLVSFVTVYSAVLLAVVTAVVDALHADDDEADDDRGVGSANTPSAAGAVDAD